MKTRRFPKKKKKKTVFEKDNAKNGFKMEKEQKVGYVFGKRKKIL